MAFSYGLRVGKYEIKNKLGHGGYGIVYSARDVELDRELAIKFLRPEYAARQQVVQRFLQEARSAAKIVHPNIVTVYECGNVEGTGTAADGTVFIAMELLTGESLSARLDAGQLAIDTVVALGAQMAAALEAAHKSGIVHRDLKPDNVILVPDASLPGGERVKILDFGIAKLHDADASEVTGVHTASMMMLGTPRYMSPEQCKSSARVDHRSDIYTLGCILFEMVCGQSPFDGDAGELIAKHQLAPVPPPRSIRPELSAYLDVLITTMLAKDPKDRPQTMERVRDALEASGGLTHAPASEITPDATTPDIPDAPKPRPATDSSERARPVRRARRYTIAAVASVFPIAVLVGYLVHGSPSDEPAPPPPAPVVARTAPPPDAAPDRAAKDPDTPDADGARCRELAAERKWDDLLRCADALARLGPDRDPVVNELATMSVIESRNAQLYDKLEQAASRSDLVEAEQLLARIDDESIYKEPALAAVDALYEHAPAARVARAPSCDAGKLSSRAQDAIAGGRYGSALASIEASMRCRYDPTLYRLAVLAACNSGNATKARLYYARVPAAQQGALAQLCLRNHIALR